MATDSVTKTPSDSGLQSSRRSFLHAFLILQGSFVVMIVVAAVCVGYSLQHHWEAGLTEQISRNLEQKAQMFASRVNFDHVTRVGEITSQVGHDSGARATVIDAGGTVVADSQAPPVSLTTEGEQPEFRAALRGEMSVETRSTNGIPALYVAVPVPGGAVRLAYPLADVEIAKHKSDLTLLIGCLIALVASAAVSALTAHSLGR